MKSVVKVLTLRKQEVNLVLGSTIIKINIRRKGKVTKKRFLAHYCLEGHSGIHD